MTSVDPWKAPWYDQCRALEGSMEPQYDQCKDLEGSMEPWSLSAILPQWHPILSKILAPVCRAITIHQ